MEEKRSSKIRSLILVVLILGVSAFFLYEPQPFSIIDLMEKKTNLNTEEVTGISLKIVDTVSNTTFFTASYSEMLIQYLDATIIEKSKENIFQIDGMDYMLILYTDKNAIDYGNSKRLLLKNAAGKTYIQLIGIDEYVTYEADYNGAYDLINNYLK